ncbi:hypothetical protein [Catellatospora sp. NPDC049609]|uniref:hypothetical protein n=1 Tax=Catellatospora sp. NPDC049609 TaxID=3155505 RepID=UPI0034275F6C
MRRLLIGSLVGLAIFLAMVVDTLLPGGPHLPMAAVTVPFLITFACFGGVLLALNGGKLGHLDWRKAWPVLSVLPLWLKLLAGVLLVAALVNYFLSSTGVTDEADFQRGFTGNGVWIAAGAAMMAYGVLRLRELPERTRPVPERAGRLFFGAAAVVGAVGMAATFALPHVYDQRATHDELRTRYRDTAWVSHLVAANTSGGKFLVHLDTADEQVLAAACESLWQYGAELGRTAHVRLYDGHRTRDLRSC